MDFFILDHCEGLQNQLEVTVEEPWFPNPYDPARKVLYSYDFWHSIRNLRYVIWRKKNTVLWAAVQLDFWEMLF